jgi:cyclophilin family peptidyl-prolyl cis-trans isomerase
MKNITNNIFIIATITCALFISATQPKPKPKPAEKKIETKSAPVLSTKNQYVEIETVYGNMVLKLYNETPLHRDNFISLIKNGFYDSLIFHRVIKNFMIQGGDPVSKYAPEGTPIGGGEVGYRIPEEMYPTLIHKRGALAAARDNNPEKASSGCQFYIVDGKKYNGIDLENLRNGMNYNMKNKLLQDIMATDSVKNKVDDYVARGDKNGLHAYILSLQPRVDEIYNTMEIKFTPFQKSVYTSIGGAPNLDMNYTVFGELVEGFNVLDSIASVKTGAMDRPLKDVRMKIKLLK